MTVSSAIKSLVKYAEKEGLIEAPDERWAVNRILEILSMDSIETDAEVFEDVKLEELLKILLDYACENDRVLLPPFKKIGLYKRIPC